MLQLRRLVEKHTRLKLRHGFIHSRNLAYSGDSQAEILSKYPVGLHLHGYSIEQVQPVPEFSLVAVRLRHQRTGAEHLHLDKAHDKNNVFLVAFKTNPPDATGVPHILEHTTLCGSYKYPVRDPFFKMLNRSLSNFMNAMTGHDYTFYPFATTNTKDFENLMDVYLSSVFEPLLKYEDFMQEGWRLENSDPADSKSPLVFKGVVYNEMKGQYSNSSYLFWIKFQEAMYSSLNNSGGDPSKITDLQYEDLVDFHAVNYHPSNARTFTYGGLSLPDVLTKLNDFFGPYGKRATRKDVKQPDYLLNSLALTDVTVKGPVDTLCNKPVKEQHKSSVTWMLGNPLEDGMQYDIFKWKILSSLLCDGHSAPFYEELIEKEFGDDFTVNTGLDSTTALLSFTVGLNNLSLERAEKLEDKIYEIVNDKVIPELQKAEESSFHHKIEAILHQIEINFKKHKPDFGLGLLNSIVPTWTNGLNPIASLQVESILNRFKSEYAEHGLSLFECLIKDTILNPDTVKFRFRMEPDEAYNEDLAKEETARLSKHTSEINEEDKDIIHRRNLNLAEKQNTEEDLSILPTLTIADIPKQGDYYPLQFSSINSKELQKRIVDTNGLIYMTAAKDISFLPSKYYKYLPLFTSCLTNLAGTRKTPIQELETRIQRTTGGLSFSVNSFTDPYNISKANLKFVVSGMALKDKSQHVYNLWHEILAETKFDSNDEAVIDKLYTLVKNLGQNQLDVIAERGHAYASSLSTSKLSPAKHLKDILSGFEHVQFVLDLNLRLEKGGKEYLLKELLPVLKDIQTRLISGYTRGVKGFNYSLVGDSETVALNEVLVKEFDNLLESSFPSEEQQNCLDKVISSFLAQREATNERQVLVDLPFQVGYASLAKLGAEYVNKEGAALQVLAQLLTFKHLHSVIRESNGAYGGGVQSNGLGGTLNFYSYRDPNPVKSISSFKEAGQVALSKMDSESGWNKKDLEEAKLAIFQSVDAPMNVSSQGSSTFLEGITDDMRQTRREMFLDVGYDDLRSVADKYLVKSNNDVATVICDHAMVESTDLTNSWEVKSLSV